MPCYHPLRAFRDTPDGKIYFGAPHCESSVGMRLPCGGCDGCRRERARQWAMRCLHEASLHDDNCFVTLTYDEGHLPSDGSLDKSDFQKFMKRLRKARYDAWVRAGRCGDPPRFSFYHVGEYGSITYRPHYHALLFGVDFPDKYCSGRSGLYPVWRSPCLEALWDKGLSQIGTVNFHSVSYVSRYMVKKHRDLPAQVDLETGERLPDLVKEYSTMSRRPALGAGWVAKNLCDVYPRDGVVVRGRVLRPPRFYDGKFELFSPEEMALVRERRRKRCVASEGTSRRLLVREEVADARERSSGGKRGL